MTDKVFLVSQRQIQDLLIFFNQLETSEIEKIKIDTILDMINNIKQLKKAIDNAEAILLDPLTHLVADGKIEYSFDYNDFRYTLTDGRKKWEYPNTIKQLEKELKEAKEKAQASGAATFTASAQFWTVRTPQS
jgi:hypothetical protein